MFDITKTPKRLSSYPKALICNRCLHLFTDNPWADRPCTKCAVEIANCLMPSTAAHLLRLYLLVEEINRQEEYIYELKSLFLTKNTNARPYNPYHSMKMYETYRNDGKSRIGQYLYNYHGWQSRFASSVGVSLTRVSRWLREEGLPVKYQYILGPIVESFSLGLLARVIEHQQQLLTSDDSDSFFDIDPMILDYYFIPDISAFVSENVITVAEEEEQYQFHKLIATKTEPNLFSMFLYFIEERRWLYGPIPAKVRDTEDSEELFSLSELDALRKEAMNMNISQ